MVQPDLSDQVPMDLFRALRLTPVAELPQGVEQDDRHAHSHGDVDPQDEVVQIVAHARGVGHRIHTALAVIVTAGGEHP